MSKPEQPRPDTLQVTAQLRKSVVITCASMATTVLGAAYSLWRARQLVSAFSGGELPLMLRVLIVLVAICAVVTAVGMVAYMLAALPVLARGRQRAIERLLSAQAWLWSLMGVSIVGMLGVVVVAKISNFLGGLWPF